MVSHPPNPTERLGAQVPVSIPLKLCVITGPDAGAELALDKGSYRIGKDADNDLTLNDTAVSRTHLLVSVLAEGVELKDNNSTNGSFCNEMRFSTLVAKPGAILRIGRSELQVLPRSLGKGALPASGSDRFGGMVGRSLPMREVFALLTRLANSDVDVLIEGETGTGKELCAEALHQASPRGSGPFVVCDLGGVAPSLFESELFGHVKGAFTGAHSDRAGAFERAEGGTLFLDEVGEMPLEIQTRLLRALERRQVKRVGSNDYKLVNIRVIAATHRDLEADQKTGRFREDLFHRLAVARVRLPPLRERPEDVPALVDSLLSRMGKAPSDLSDETRALLVSYRWPGNVRELRNVVERIVHLGVTPELQATAPQQPAVATGADASVPFKEAKDRLVTAFERDYLKQLLTRCEGNVSKAAREAGIARYYVHQLIKKHGLSPVRE